MLEGIDLESLRFKTPQERRELRKNNPRRRVRLSQFVRAYNTTPVTARSLRHAWNPKNKRTVCGVAVVATDEPRVKFTSDPVFNCASCQRQWERWVNTVPLTADEIDFDQLEPDS